jgi:hypothetical protein
VGLSVHVDLGKGDGGKGRGEEAEREAEVTRARGKVVRQPRQPHDLPHSLPEIPKRTAFSVHYKPL